MLFWTSTTATSETRPKFATIDSNQARFKGAAHGLEPRLRINISVPKQASAKNLVAPIEDLIRYHREMVFLRHFEEKCNFAYRQGKAGGYLHVYIGMEPLAIGWLNQIRKGYDYVITAYRDHGHALVLGSDPVATMAEIMGRSGGQSRGKGGSMHIYDVDKQFYGGWGIVGGHTALGGGLALAAKYRRDDRVTLCYLGDGAANAFRKQVTLPLKTQLV